MPVALGGDYVASRQEQGSGQALAGVVHEADSLGNVYPPPCVEPTSA